MPSPRVLLIGGHGKIAQLLTPHLLSRSYDVTSLIRSPDQTSTITSLGTSHPGHLDVLVSSLEDIKTESQAQAILNSTNPTHVVWSAGAGGVGGPDRTFAIDRDACVAFLRAAAGTKCVKKFVVISYIGSRRRRALWWSDEEWKAVQGVNNGVLKNYHIAKVAADEALTALGKARGDGFAAISLRPGTLTDEVGEQQVSLGKVGARGKVSRETVARVTAEVLERVERSCWLDLLEGTEQVQEAVGRCISEKVDCVQGEDVEAMIQDWT